MIRIRKKSDWNEENYNIALCPSYRTNTASCRQDYELSNETKH